MKNTLKSIVQQFPATPFLFVGSGMSKRYMGLPSWEDLLRHFAERLSGDSFAYAAYKSRAGDDLPKVASLIQKDFDARWFDYPSFRTCDEEHANHINNGASPFKAEIAYYLSSISQLNSDLSDEIESFSMLMDKNITGIITTNYDLFLEGAAAKYKKYIGQEELVFSSIQGIAEIYKIHGCVSNPGSIVINEEDYSEFEKNSPYLAAKLMTIFMEYPIIFLGYSMADRNIRSILEAIARCLSPDKLDRLKNRFIFVEYSPKETDLRIESFATLFGGKSITMTKIVLSDFSILYEALMEKKNSIPVRILRTFKQEFYDFTVSNTPTARLRVMDIDDKDLDDADLALAFGRKSDIGVYGLTGVTGREWYRDIIMDDLGFSSDELLTHAFPKLCKGNDLPVFKHLRKASIQYPDVEEYASKIDFESIIPESIRKQRYRVHDIQNLGERSVEAIVREYGQNVEKCTRLLSYLTEEEIDADALYDYLRKLFEDNQNVLDVTDKAIASKVRKLIRFYDFLKYKQK